MVKLINLNKNLRRLRKLIRKMLFLKVLYMLISIIWKTRKI
nr:MAG TPA: hypothetical protein [Caudoviricetes sp.]